MMTSTAGHRTAGVRTLTAARNCLWVSVLVAVISFLHLTAGKIAACGLELSPIQTHFENVDYRGYVFVVHRLGEIQADQKTVPIIATFGSKRDGTSPYAGFGWEIPLLESKILQTAENTFELHQPDGRFRQFWRDARNPQILNGQGGWKAEIRGNLVTAWAECGSRLLFQDGKIVSLQLKNDKLDYTYENGFVRQIRKGSAIVLRVERDPIKRTVSLILDERQRIELGFEQRPRIQNLGGQRIVASVENALGSFTRQDGGKTVMSYDLDSQKNPTLKIDDDRILTWSADTRRILHDSKGAWTYEIAPGPSEYSNAAMRRKNAHSHMEFWHRDTTAGKEITQTANGTTRIETWFTTGIMAGFVRKKEEVRNGVTKVVYQASYNEKGKLFRETLESGSIRETAFDENGKKLSVTTTLNGKETSRTEYQDERETRTWLHGALHSEKSYGEDGSWQKNVIFDKKSGKPARTFLKQFDEFKREISEKVTEHSGKYPEKIRKSVYNAAGELQERVTEILK